MLQKNDIMWSPVAYAQVEKKALDATWACERFSSFILGRPFQLETDHKSLVSLQGGKALDDSEVKLEDACWKGRG